MGFFRRRQEFRHPSRWSFNLGGKWTNLTALLVTAVVVIFVFAYGNRPAVEGTTSLTAALSVSYRKIAEGQVWRILSAPFLCSGILQLFFACMALYFFGGYVARRLGFFWFMFAYLACGAAGGLACSLAAPGVSFEAAPAAVYGIILLCMLYFPYMYFLGGATARQLGPVLMGAVMLASLNFDGNDLSYLAYLAALPVAYGVFKLEPAVQRMRGRWRMRREIVDAFTEAEREEHLDRLLKKVAQEGMDSLNRKERHFLQTVSKEYRRKKVKNNH
jgi:membrane associated rhomboid family serine protease